MSDEFKTEEPTAHRLTQARQKGQVFKSQELIFALMLLTVFSILKSTSMTFYNQFISLTETTILKWDIYKFGVMPVITQYSFIMLKLIAPILASCFLIAVIANVAQIGFLLTAHPLEPNWSKMNPIEGFKKLYSNRAWFELAKNSIKIILTFIIVVAYINKSFIQISHFFHQSLKFSFFTTAKIIYTLGMRIAVLFLILSVFDFIYQRYMYYQNLRMTKQEVKEESKQMEGDPIVKGKQKEIRLRRARKWMMEAVKKARVVITNPTHIACALVYDDGMEAPKLVAKGQNFIAENIVKVAKENKVPIMENKPVAWALFKNVDIDEFVPSKLYPIVAEVIFFVMQLEEAERQEREET